MIDKKILKIKTQGLSTLLSDFFICEHCGIVDRENNRIEYGFICPNCGKPGEGGYFYFPIGIPSLIDLMQEFYHLQKSEVNNILSFKNDEGNHKLAIIIFFCSLGELLLENFISLYMNKLNIPERIQEKLLWDVSIIKRLELYKTLTNKKFKDDISKLDKHTSFDYKRVFDFYIDVRNKRNKFLHAGRTGLITKEMPEQCILNIFPLLNLFVDLHNKYIANNIKGNT